MELNESLTTRLRQIFDQRPPLTGVGDPVEIHRRAGHQRLGIGDKAVEKLGGPERMALRELAKRRGIIEGRHGGYAPPDDPVQRRALELRPIHLECMAAVAFLVGALAKRQIGVGGRRGRAAAGRQSGGRCRAKEKLQLALPVRTTMIRLVPDSGR